MTAKTITLFNGTTELQVPLRSIMYVKMEGNIAYIHISQRQIYQTRMTLGKIEKLLGDDFIKITRGCMVSLYAIYDIGETVNLNNGESLEYPRRNRNRMKEKLYAKQRELVHNFSESVPLITLEEYHDHYQVFDSMPIAFADIEMIFDENNKAVDWVFRYANKALADLEKLPLKKMLGKTFKSIFPNMDVKWLRTYERAILYGETLKIIDYSPEIDTYLDIICFPTFKGHCGCVLFDIEKVISFRNPTSAEKALAAFFSRLTEGN